MTVVTQKSRPGSIVAEVVRLRALEDKSAKKSPAPEEAEAPEKTPIKKAKRPRK